MTYEEAKNYLSKFGQEHILKCYDELSPAEQASLLAQIDLIDLSVLENLDNDITSAASAENLSRSVLQRSTI